MPLSRGSGPLVPGMPSTSEPKFVPRSGGSTAWPNRVHPNVPSIRNLGDDRVGVADARELHERVAVAVAAVAQALAAGLAKAEVAVDQRVHQAVLEPELMPLVAVPVDLGVEVVAVAGAACRS